MLIIAFYFWASSSNFEVDEYSKIIINNYPTEITNDSVYSIITYNIGYLSGMTNNLPIKKEAKFFDENLKSVVTEFKRLDPDIIAFQEIDFASKRSYDVNQQNEIAKLGYNFVGQVINWDKKYLPFPEFPISMHYGRILSGQSILSKYEITQQDRLELKRNATNPFYYDAFYLDRLAQTVKINITKSNQKNQTLVIINVHTEAFHQETRIEQIEKIIHLFQTFKKEYPTILLGDFNSDVNYENAGIELLLNLPKTGCAAFERKNASNTFDSEKPSERLDYIFYNTDFIEYVHGEVLSEFNQASDHLPLLMKFKLK
jgi:endonuclease/exonuclease/phosphatase family metal-dependent hydrolase